MLTYFIALGLGLAIGVIRSRKDNSRIVKIPKIMSSTLVGFSIGVTIYLFGGLLFPAELDHSFGTPLVVVDDHLGYRSEDYVFHMIDENDKVVVDRELFYGEAIIVYYRNPHQWLKAFFAIHEYEVVTILIPSTIVMDESLE